MRNKFGCADGYSSPSRNVPAFVARNPSVAFYWKLFWGPVWRLCLKARRGQLDDELWIDGSSKCADILEECGVRFEIEGLDILRQIKEPCIFIANHMSTLETFVLPAVIRPYLPLTFVVKKSLTKMPFFGYVMRSRDPVAVGRQNPREDLETILNQGTDRLARGFSLLIFPQGTRSLAVRPDSFNSIGVKLARKAGVPVVPLAIKSDAWGNGRKIKELGSINTDLPVRMKFGPLLRIAGRGRDEHVQVCGFISRTVGDWQSQDGMNTGWGK